MSIEPMVDVSVGIDDGVPGVTPGSSSVYSVVVANVGPSAVVDLRMTSDVTGLGNLDWQCVQAESSATCPVPDVGAGVFDVLLAMEAGQSMRFEVVGTALGQAGTYVLHGVDLTPPAGTTAIQPGDDRATDTGHPDGDFLEWLRGGVPVDVRAVDASSCVGGASIRRGTDGVEAW